MRITPGLVISLIAGACAASAINCADSGDTSSPTGSRTGTTGTGTATSTGTNTGTPGGSATGTATPGGSATGTGSGGGSAADPCPEVGAVHLLVSEVASHGAPGAGGGSVGGNYEFVEIWNPTNAAVDLSKYYLSDNGDYYRIAYGEAWTPTTSNPGTDFLAKFPAGASIPAGGYVIVQAGPDFESAWGSSPCPDFAIGTDAAPSCNGNAVTLMEEPANGDRGTQAGSMLSNSREMIVLFCWDGVSTIVKDVDYVPWGDSDEVPARIDKTGQAGYQADTAIGSQQDAPRYFTQGAGGGLGESIGRCDGSEDGEAITSGNGPNGHDETSESFSQTIEIQTTGSPGAVNSCN